MMKILCKRSLFAFIMLLTVAISRPADAFWFLAIDPYPMPDLPDNVISFTKSLTRIASSAKETINTAENSLNSLKQMKEAILSGEILKDQLARENNQGMKELADCTFLGKTYSMKKADHVAELSRILFLQYPADPAKENDKIYEYDQYRKQFFQDSLLEIHTAATQLTSEVDNFEESVKKSMDCAKGEGTDCGDSAPKPEGGVDATYVEGEALQALANVYELFLKTTALKAQLAAVKAINKNEPARFVEGVKDEPIIGDSGDSAPAPTPTDQNAGLLDNSGVVYASANVSTDYKLAFAQVRMTAKSTATTLSDIEASSKLSKSVSKKYVDGALSFVMAPEAPNKHPYVAAADKLSELDKFTPLNELLDSAVQTHNLLVKLPQYKASADDINKAKEAQERSFEFLRKSNNCALDYMGRRFEDAHIPWAGRNLGNRIDNADVRRGISGWALEAYETAKAAQVTDDSISDSSPMDIDGDTADFGDITGIDKAQKSLEDSGTMDVSANKKEQAQKESRETSMIAWQIGSDAAHMIADEPAKWGAPTQPERVWTDVKTFYNQYLHYKYANIRSYLRSYSKNDVLAVVAEKLQGRDTEISTNKKQAAIEAENLKLSEELAATRAQQAEDVASQNAKHGGMLAQLNERKKVLLSKIANLEKQKKEETDKISDLRDKAQDDSMENMRSIVTHKAKFPTSGFSVANEAPAGTRQVADVEASQANFAQGSAENKESDEMATARKSLTKVNADMGALEAQMNTLENEMIEYRRGAANSISDLLERVKQASLAKSDAVMNRLSALDVSYSNDVKATVMSILRENPSENPLLTPEIIYAGLERAAGAALDELYIKVDARVAVAEAALAGLGDALYNADNHAKIVEIHQSMINDIKAMTIAVAAVGVGTIDNLRLYAKLEAIDTTPETEDYFVGATAKPRDMKAPKAIFEMNLPPLREAVHFDDTDWQNVTPFVDGSSQRSKIMKEDFLNYGGKVPEIWKYMLKDNAFVEKSLDMKSALNKGCEAETMLRAGVMPCQVKDTAIVLDVNNEAKYVLGAKGKNLPICSGIKMKGGSPLHVLRNAKISFALSFFSEKAASADCPYSELGTLLDADEGGNLYFREATNEAFYHLVYYMKHPDKKLKDKDRELMSIYDNVPLNRNQQSQFLTAFEDAQSQTKNLEEVTEEHKQQIEELVDILKTYGYTPSANFDLSNKSVYDQTRKRLDEIKNRLISQIQTDMAGVDVADNAVAEERLGVVEATIRALLKDNEEYVSLRVSADVDKQIDEDIKSAKVNEKAGNKYNESVKKSAEDLITETQPYCPAY